MLAVIVRVERLRRGDLWVDSISIVYIDRSNFGWIQDFTFLFGQRRTFHILILLFKFFNIDVNLIGYSPIWILAGKLLIQFFKLVLILLRYQLILLIYAFVQPFTNTLVTRVLNFAFWLVEQIWRINLRFIIRWLFDPNATGQCSFRVRSAAHSRYNFM